MVHRRGIASIKLDVFPVYKWREPSYMKCLLDLEWAVLFICMSEPVMLNNLPVVNNPCHIQGKQPEQSVMNSPASALHNSSGLILNSWNQYVYPRPIYTSCPKLNGLRWISRAALGATKWWGDMTRVFVPWGMFVGVQFSRELPGAYNPSLPAGWVYRCSYPGFHH